MNGLMTFTVVAGGTACNAKCPCCVARMTGSCGVPVRAPEFNEWQWQNFDSACRIATKSPNITSAVITSKGEATISKDSRDQLTKIIERMEPYHFPLLDLQTNGIAIADKPEEFEPYLVKWRRLGLNTIAISHVHYEPEKNREFYVPHRKSYIDLPALIKNLHNPERKFSVRLTTILADGYIDSPEKVANLIKFAKDNQVEQLSLKVMTKPEQSLDEGVYKWCMEHHLSDKQTEDIENYLSDNGNRKPRWVLPHGAPVYSIDGVTCSFTSPSNDCFKLPVDKFALRQLIFFPDGSLRDGWGEDAGRLL